MRTNGVKENKRACQSAIAFALNRKPSQPTLSVQLLYEDKPSAISAAGIVEQMLGHLLFKPELEFNLWRFDVLCDPDLREFAAQEIRQADIVLVVPHKEKELPEPVCESVLDWISAGKKKPRALGLFLNACKDLATPRALNLEDAAIWAGVQVFLHLSEPASVALPEPIEMATQTRELPSYQKYRHWGLNE